MIMVAIVGDDDDDDDTRRLGGAMNDKLSRTEHNVKVLMQHRRAEPTP